jgi:hypothetical protein
MTVDTTEKQRIDPYFGERRERISTAVLAQLVGVAGGGGR